MPVKILLDLNAEEGQVDAIKAYFSEILVDTRSYKGCIKIDVLSNLDNPNNLVIYEMWENRQAYQEYYNWRTDTGVFEKLGEMITTPPKLTFFEIENI